MNRAATFRDNVKSAWASQPEFSCRCGTLRAIVQNDMGLIIQAHSATNLRNANDKCLAEFGAWLVDTFGEKGADREGA